MMFETFQEAWHMQGHGFYVWLSYAVTWVVVAGLIIAPLRKKAKVLKDVAARAKAERQAQQQKSQKKQSEAMKEIS